MPLRFSFILSRNIYSKEAQYSVFTTVLRYGKSTIEIAWKSQKILHISFSVDCCTFAFLVGFGTPFHCLLRTLLHWLALSLWIIIQDYYILFHHQSLVARSHSWNFLHKDPKIPRHSTNFPVSVPLKEFRNPSCTHSFHVHRSYDEWYFLRA